MLLRLGVIIAIGLLGHSACRAQDTPEQKPAAEMSIKEIMAEAHKKPTQLLKQVATGKANETQKKRLVALYEALAKAKPSKGSAESWTEKTGLMVEAAKAVVANKPEAQKQVTKAANCVACHKAHKGK